uniref:Uncharacterized protein n=1 Tax=Xiphophorus couchianus TaxID=32473 RepID=A0A3B5M8W4_9TELE
MLTGKWVVREREELWQRLTEPRTRDGPRNHTCARCAVKDSARAPTSSPTAESTTATGLSAAPAVSSPSSAGWTYSATMRHSAAMERLPLKYCDKTVHIVHPHKELYSMFFFYLMSG